MRALESPVKTDVDTDGYIGEFDDRCQGAILSDRYCIAFDVVAVRTEKRFTELGSPFLDAVNAFDRAEVERANIGQINLIEVSSFCSPQGLIWGHDAARPDALCEKPLFVVGQWDGASVPVYDGEPLIEAAEALFGTRDRRRFPLSPGTHCRAAYKHVILDRPGVAYAACGVGIRDPRDASASILMEDVAVFPGERAGDPSRREGVIASIAESVATIAANQRIRCSKIFVMYAETEAERGEIACALTAVPYFRLAKNAVPGGDLARIGRLSLADWRRETAG